MASEASGQQKDQNPTFAPFIVIIGVLLIPIVIAALVASLFVMTQDIMVLLFGSLALLPVYMFVLHWVWRDANEQGMQATLWLVVVVFLFALGLAIYLIVRELRIAIRDR